MPGVRREAASSVPDLDAWKFWRPEAQARGLQLLEERKANPWRPFYCANRGCNGHPHCISPINALCENPTGHSWTQNDDQWHLAGRWHCHECGVKGELVDKWAWEHAREDQHPPTWSDDWLYWLMSGGRGSGKTRGGSEVTHKATSLTPRIILIAPTGPDLRETMVEGMSGILACSPPGKRPEWEPSKKKLTWPNGCIGLGFSAEEPDRLRGPQSGYIWADEPAHYANTGAVMDNALFGHRVKNEKGFDPKIVLTTTPKPTPWMKDTVADESTRVHRVSTYANLANLAPKFRERVLKRYEGTRTGRQELHGEMLEDVEGALWKWAMFRRGDEESLPAMLRTVIAVDPAGTANARSDETGIIVVGITVERTIWVIADYTERYSPHGWATKVAKAYEKFSADAIVAETNYGGDMVRTTLEGADYDALVGRIVEVNSRKGKQIRAEPVVALYERDPGKVFHLWDDPDGERNSANKLIVAHDNLAKLEAELTEWVPGESASPNRLDALVHGVTELGGKMMPVEMATPGDIAKLLAESGSGAGAGLGTSSYAYGLGRH